MEHLKSSQEEADTKVILHCLDALKTPEATVVLRITLWGYGYNGACGYANPGSLCASFFQVMVVENTVRTLYLSEITMSDKEKDALLGFRAFTGNDGISAIFMKGKALCWKTMLTKESFVQIFADFGANTFELEKQTLLLLGEFVCHLYGYKCMSVKYSERQDVQQEKFNNVRKHQIYISPSTMLFGLPATCN